MNGKEKAELDWNGRTPVSRRFDDPYFSLENGLAETKHVFLDGNDLPARFAPGFHIAELGFGTGLNALAAWRCWLDAGQTGRLRFTSFESFPMAATDMARALEPFEDLADLVTQLTDAWAQGPSLTTDTIELTVVLGDARRTLAQWDGTADAWFLDGFAPAQNPEMWEEGVLSNVARCTAPRGTFATYTAAGAVRRGLETAGFEVTRRPGYGRKRHMSVGQLP